MGQVRTVTLALGLLLAIVRVAAQGAGDGSATGFGDSLALRPNIVLIVADDLGYGDLGCYGQARIRTPRLDQMAAEGMRFTQFYAGATVCAPSRSVLMTGQHGGRTWVRGNAGRGDRDIQSLRPEDTTVAEVLAAAGYRTGLVGKWGLGEVDDPGHPLAQGFDSFFGYLDQTHAHNYYPRFLWRDRDTVPLGNVVRDVPHGGSSFVGGYATTRVDYTADLFAAEALAFVAQPDRAQPFFLTLALTAPHANNQAGDAGMEVPSLAPYADQPWPEPQRALAAMVTRMDGDVGRLLDTLAALGLDSTTLVIFTSDNGPHAEGGNDPAFFDSNGPLRGVKRDLYEGGIRVPLIARWPGHVPAGVVSEHVGYFGDVMATVAALAGARPPQEVQSVSLAPTLLGDTARQAEHAYLYWEFYERGSAQAVRFGDWKAVRAPLGTGPIELYDLAADPGESRDLAAERPELVAEARRAMAEAHVPSPNWRVVAKGG